ncbi:MAG: PAS domain-containing sensor histidine kinase [Candidatus Hodarchaeales archaeon]|jgi:PAS domain S-box-containing protein
MKLESLSKPELIEKVKKLQMSDDRFHSLVEHTSDSIFCYEYNPPISINLPISKQIEMLHDGILVECNDIAAKSYGYTRASEVLGKPLLELFRAPPGSLNDFFRSFIENGYRTFNAEAHEILEDGSKRYFLNNGHAAIKNGYLERVWGTYREITELKKAEEKYRMLITTMTEGVWVTDLQDKTILVNPALEKILGYSQEEFMGQSVFEFLVPESRSVFKNKMEERFIDKKTSDTYELTFMHKDGNPIITRIAGTSILNEQMIPIGSFGVISDITAQKLVEKERLELEERRAEFMSITSHELRTPLTNIRGFIDLVNSKEKSLSPEDQMKCLDIALRNINRLERLISGVSTLTQIERGVLHFEFEPINMCNFLDNLVNPYRILYENQVHYSCQCDSSECFTSIDPSMMRQAIENILQNAVKQTNNENRKIEVSCTIKSDSFQFSISDNGAGIRKKHQLRIFDSFVSIPTKYSAQGSGIGLYLAKIIVEAHIGTISVLSEGLNQGATFIINLPLIK